MTKEEALTKALNQLKRADQIIQSLCPQGYIHPALCSIHGAIVNVQEALAQPEQEPVAWMYINTDGECEQIEYGEPFDDPSTTPLYTTPPQRTWVGLTDEEMHECAGEYPWTPTGLKCVRTIEAKLKQKNGFSEEKNT